MLLITINNFIEKHDLLPDKPTVVVGLSGGPDSVFLLDYLASLKKVGRIKEIIAAHLNHQWRSDADKDEQFCKQLAEQYHIPFESAHLSDIKLPKKSARSKEAIGRDTRRAFLESVHKKYNANCIALAHHLNDQEETFLIRLVRGTSLTGLTGMWPKSGVYIRPLLEITKQEIVHYLEQHKIPFLTDPSNISQEFLRNRIRLNVIPALQQADERFDYNFLTTLNRLQETELLLEELTTQIYSQIISDKGLSLEQLFAQPIAMQYRLLMHWLCAHKIPFPASHGFLEEILRFLKQPGSKTHTIHEKWQINKKKNFAFITH